MRQLGQLTVALTLICAGATALLAYVNQATGPAIREVERRAQEAALQEVLPGFDGVEKKSITVGKSPFLLFPATRGGQPVGVAIQGSTFQGFSGEIKVMVGFDAEGRIHRVKVLSHTETPGLGTKVTDRTREKTIRDLFIDLEDPGIVPNPFLDQFEQQTAAFGAAAVIGKGVDAISGATVTSKAVTDAVTHICKVYGSTTAGGGP